jgi:peptidoglycan/xylan/chitin deacetylase (PgdA/CDA1 family)
VKYLTNKSNSSRQYVPPKFFSLCEGQVLTEQKIDCYEATKAAFQQSKDWQKKVETIQLDGDDRSTKKISWPNEKIFGACLTHDVDNVAKYRCVMHGRRLRGQIKSYFKGYERRALAGIKSSFLGICDSVVKQGRNDPLFCYERWLEIEQLKNVRSTFLFLPHTYEKSHYSDGGYRYDDTILFDQQQCSVREMIKEIHDRGWEIGLHASWYSYNDPRIFSQQKAELEGVIESEIISSRQHNLHFDIRYTPKILEQSGIKIDSSIGFNDKCGFRYGTSVPWQLKPAHSTSSNTVWELPMCIQDKAIMNIVAERSFEFAISVAQEIIQQAKEEGGVVCLLWHPRTIQWPDYIKMYESLIDILQQEGAWFGTMRGIYNLRK